MILAELEVWHSRPIAPTRRVAVGRALLPCDPAPGFGGVLLGAVCARFAPELDPELLPDVGSLTHELTAGRRIPQPRLRHRFQQDRVGLSCSVQRLHGCGECLSLDLTHRNAAPAQLVLAAVYAAGRLDPVVRPAVMEAIRRGLAWSGEPGPALFTHLAGGGRSSVSLAGVADPVGWAMTVLGLDTGNRSPGREVVQHCFRRALRDAHPDHGGMETEAAVLIADISEARRILLAG